MAYPQPLLPPLNNMPLTANSRLTPAQCKLSPHSPRSDSEIHRYSISTMNTFIYYPSYGLPPYL